ncbi:rhodanese-like domain-containing protein [Oceanimonas baumannii]|uniref:Rhodanese-like domain-containing protein n=1 Tax=Oceanimonas baumannii TaxID=129578 RepID=A0A235CGL7_9GAMM|nr:rhodanese-like domain-containing protein [Oceanimonas baumannii]MCC4264349.1 rhodanese-like domain-containing protein [Oceanimonas baumannii]OYD23606.1 rhodanese-like domain-containing protein [Oceanimonas baumannii]TDW56853.1 rhodanese-related sulfurtransferase [Oceanimonas baumannii]
MQEYLDFAARHPLLTMVWLGLVMAVLYTFVIARLSKVKVVPAQEAVMLINKQNAAVVDIRTAEEFRKGHIAGAINVPNSQLKANNLNLIEKYKDKPLVLVCESGMTTSGAGRLLSKAGFSQVHTLRGGMTDWRTQNLPVTTKR